MRQIFRVTIAAVAALALGTGTAWAGATVLGDGQLADIWAGEIEVEDNKVAAALGAAANDDIAAASTGGIASAGSGDVKRNDEFNEAFSASLANSGKVSQDVKDSQNEANGQNLSNAMLSGVVQQNNIVSRGSDIKAFGLLIGIGLVQSNYANVNNFSTTPGVLNAL